MLFLSESLIATKIYEEDSKNWRKEVESKITLNLYKHKTEISEIKWFRNHPKYSTMMQARSNTLDLGWRNRNSNSDKICKLCNLEIETLTHFLLNCHKLQDIRNSYAPLQLPQPEDNLELLKEFLLLDNKFDEKPIVFIDLLFKMWKFRMNLLKLEDTSFYGF